MRPIEALDMAGQSFLAVRRPRMRPTAKTSLAQTSTHLPDLPGWPLPGHSLTPRTDRGGAAVHGRAPRFDCLRH